MTEQRYQVRDDAGVDDHLYLLITSIGQIRQSPDCVNQDLQETNSRLFPPACTTHQTFPKTKSDGLLTLTSM